MNLSIIEWIIFGFDLTYFSLPYKIRIDYFYPYPSSKEGNEFNPMSTIKQSYHGSDIEIIEKVYNIPKEEIINFSGNVNPLGVSKTVKEELAAHLDLISTYPDRNYTTLRQKIGTYVDTNPKNIIVGNGATELISILIQNLKPTHALIIGPTYSEYEREIRLEGGNVHYYALTESLDFQIHVPDLLQQITTSIGLLVICNPNNPTSSAFSQKDLIQIL
ncbi:MAG: aminotransferase class I/II-fold pyridoxal phosphate-dependent enzyme, partial [Epulopiscium sp.]|nr:aminotransferase class I/II-fold pyridoxal phosphate-dependent enzyme [Candidatus Epulonipiscium sp.]